MLIQLCFSGKARRWVAVNIEGHQWWHLAPNIGSLTALMWHWFIYAYIYLLDMIIDCMYCIYYKTTGVPVLFAGILCIYRCRCYSDDPPVQSATPYSWEHSTDLVVDETWFWVMLLLYMLYIVIGFRIFPLTWGWWRLSSYISYSLRW